MNHHRKPIRQTSNDHGIPFGTVECSCGWKFQGVGAENSAWAVLVAEHDRHVRTETRKQR